MTRSYDPELYEFDRAIYNQYAEFDREMGLLESHMESGWWGETPPLTTPNTPIGQVFLPGENVELRRIQEEINRGNRDRNKLTDLIFHKRHPERRGAALRTNEKALIREWQIIGTLVDSAINIDMMGKRIEELVRQLTVRP